MFVKFGCGCIGLLLDEGQKSEGAEVLLLCACDAEDEPWCFQYSHQASMKQKVEEGDYTPLDFHQVWRTRGRGSG